MDTTEKDEKGVMAEGAAGDAEAGGGGGCLMRLKKDLSVNKELLPFKLVSFLLSGGIVAFLPYLNVQMRDLGFSIKDIGIVQACMPLPAILGPLLSGIVADKMANYKMVMMVNMMLMPVFFSAFILFPVPPRNPLTLTCSTESSTLTWASCHDCHDTNNGNRFNMMIQNCKFLCDTTLDEFTFCVKDGETETCKDYGLGQKIPVNASLLSQREGETCSHVAYDKLNRPQTVTCPRECPMECQITGVSDCSDNASTPSGIFWSYLICRMSAIFFMSSAFTMLETVSLAGVKQHSGQYGKQRIFASFGQSTIPLLSGILITAFSSDSDSTNYIPAFILGDVCIIGALFVTYRLSVEVDPPNRNFISVLLKLLTRGEINVFLLMFLFLGILWGFIETYLFIFLTTLGAPKYLLGLSLTVALGTGLPFLAFADTIVKKIGRQNIFMFSFLIYTIRLFGYSFIKTPWMVLPFEALEVFSHNLMRAAAIMYCPVLAPKGLLATLTGLGGSVHYCIGKGLGAITGGYLIASVGDREAFRMFGYIAIVGGIIYCAIYRFYLRDVIAQREHLSEKKHELESIENSGSIENNMNRKYSRISNINMDTYNNKKYSFASKDENGTICMEKSNLKTNQGLEETKSLMAEYVEESKLISTTAPLASKSLVYEVTETLPTINLLKTESKPMNSEIKESEQVSNGTEDTFEQTSITQDKSRLIEQSRSTVKDQLCKSFNEEDINDFESALFNSQKTEESNIEDSLPSTNTNETSTSEGAKLMRSIDLVPTLRNVNKESESCVALDLQNLTNLGATGIEKYDTEEMNYSDSITISGSTINEKEQKKLGLDSKEANDIACQIPDPELGDTIDSIKPTKSWVCGESDDTLPSNDTLNIKYKDDVDTITGEDKSDTLTNLEELIIEDKDAVDIMTGEEKSDMLNNLEELIVDAKIETDTLLGNDTMMSQKEDAVDYEVISSQRWVCGESDETLPNKNILISDLRDEKQISNTPKVSEEFVEELLTTSSKIGCITDKIDGLNKEDSQDLKSTAEDVNIESTFLTNLGAIELKFNESDITDSVDKYNTMPKPCIESTLTKLNDQRKDSNIYTHKTKEDSETSNGNEDVSNEIVKTTYKWACGESDNTLPSRDTIEKNENEYDKIMQNKCLENKDDYEILDSEIKNEDANEDYIFITTSIDTKNPKESENVDAKEDNIMVKKSLDTENSKEIGNIDVNDDNITVTTNKDTKNTKEFENVHISETSTFMSVKTESSQDIQAVKETNIVNATENMSTQTKLIESNDSQEISIISDQMVTENKLSKSITKEETSISTPNSVEKYKDGDENSYSVESTKINNDIVINNSDLEAIISLDSLNKKSLTDMTDSKTSIEVESKISGVKNEERPGVINEKDKDKTDLVIEDENRSEYSYSINDKNSTESNSENLNFDGNNFKKIEDRDKKMEYIDKKTEIDLSIAVKHQSQENNEKSLMNSNPDIPVIMIKSPEETEAEMKRSNKISIITQTEITNEVDLQVQDIDEDENIVPETSDVSENIILVSVEKTDKQLNTEITSQPENFLFDAKRMSEDITDESYSTTSSASEVNKKIFKETSTLVTKVSDNIDEKKSAVIYTDEKLTEESSSMKEETNVSENILVDEKRENIMSDEKKNIFHHDTNISETNTEDGINESIKAGSEILEIDILKIIESKLPPEEAESFLKDISSYDYKDHKHYWEQSESLENSETLESSRFNSLSSFSQSHKPPNDSQELVNIQNSSVDEIQQIVKSDLSEYSTLDSQSLSRNPSHLKQGDKRGELEINKVDELIEFWEKVPFEDSEKVRHEENHEATYLNYLTEVDRSQHDNILEESIENQTILSNIKSESSPGTNTLEKRDDEDSKNKVTDSVIQKPYNDNAMYEQIKENIDDKIEQVISVNISDNLIQSSLNEQKFTLQQDSVDSEKEFPPLKNENSSLKVDKSSKTIQTLEEVSSSIIANLSKDALRLEESILEKEEALLGDKIDLREEAQVHDTLLFMKENILEESLFLNQTETAMQVALTEELSFNTLSHEKVGNKNTDEIEMSAVEKSQLYNVVNLDSAAKNNISSQEQIIDKPDTRKITMEKSNNTAYVTERPEFKDESKILTEGSEYMKVEETSIVRSSSKEMVYDDADYIKFEENSVMRSSSKETVYIIEETTVKQTVMIKDIVPQTEDESLIINEEKELAVENDEDNKSLSYLKVESTTIYRTSSVETLHFIEETKVEESLTNNEKQDYKETLNISKKDETAKVLQVEENIHYSSMATNMDKFEEPMFIEKGEIINDKQIEEFKVQNNKDNSIIATEKRQGKSTVKSDIENTFAGNTEVSKSLLDESYNFSLSSPSKVKKIMTQKLFLDANPQLKVETIFSSEKTFSNQDERSTDDLLTKNTSEAQSPLEETKTLLTDLLDEMSEFEDSTHNSQTKSLTTKFYQFKSLSDNKEEGAVDGKLSNDDEKPLE